MSKISAKLDMRICFACTLQVFLFWKSDFSESQVNQVQAKRISSFSEKHSMFCSQYRFSEQNKSVSLHDFLNAFKPLSEAV